MSDAPAMSVVLATRDRPQDASRAVRSILLNDYPAFELCVVDQSDGDATEIALATFRADARFRLLRSPPIGLAAARNVGCRASHGDVIAFTDDDCEASRDWLSAIATVFGDADRVGVTFGSVRAAPYDRGAGFVPAYEVRRPFRARKVSDKSRVEGIGACMAVRRSTWEKLGGFDELLGTGAKFRAAEDTDFAIRALLAGDIVYEAPDVVVTHYGFRTWQEGRHLIESYMFGLGVTHAKLLRLASWRALRPIAELGWRWLAGKPVVDLNHLPPRLPRLVAFVRGAREGLRTPLDPTNGRFRQVR